MDRKDSSERRVARTTNPRAEYGPFHTRQDSEIEAGKLGSPMWCATNTSWVSTKKSRRYAAFSLN